MKKKSESGEKMSEYLPLKKKVEKNIYNLKDFSDYMKASGMTEKSMKSYLTTANEFMSRYGGEITPDNIYSYRYELIDSLNPKTVNSKLMYLSKYMKFLGLNIELKCLKLTKRTFIENVISIGDYERLKLNLLQEDRKQDYYMVWTMGATGARLSELLKLKAEHIRQGYLDVHSKGKYRRIYIPKNLRESYAGYIEENKIRGYLFVSSRDPGSRRKALSENAVQKKIAAFSDIYGIDRSVMYPHSFRHMFGKAFIAKYADIALLADLMGHESIETTRIYLMMTEREQKDIVDATVTW